MRKSNLYRLGIVAAVAAFTSVACDNGDYRSSNSNTLADSAVATNPAASSTPAGQPATPSTPASTDMDTTASKSTAPAPTSAATATTTPTRSTTKSAMHRKRATTSIVLTDKMAGGTMPEFPGGKKALDNYVNDHINFPQDAIDKDAEGTVRISFVVDENGKVTKAKLMNSGKVGEGLDQEALRVVNNMPEWKPATLHGKKVKARLELPISFQVES